MLSGPYPWSSATNSANDYALANIGQLKYLFSFNTAVLSADADEDGLPDWWEFFYFGSTTAALAANDPDGDGLTNNQEFLAGTNPCSADTDGDGMSDCAEAELRDSTGSHGATGVLIRIPGEGWYHVIETGLTLIPLGE